MIIPANVQLAESHRQMFNSNEQNERMTKRPVQPGDFIAVQITDASSVTLHANPLYHCTIDEFAKTNSAY